MNVTVLCPPRSLINVPASCVEAGRWGHGRTMAAPTRHAPGSLRATKTAYLEPRADEATSHPSVQQLVWDEVERQSRSCTALRRRPRLSMTSRWSSRIVWPPSSTRSNQRWVNRRRVHDRRPGDGIGPLRQALHTGEVPAGHRCRPCPCAPPRCGVPTRTGSLTAFWIKSTLRPRTQWGAGDSVTRSSYAGTSPAPGLPTMTTSSTWPLRRKEDRSPCRFFPWWWYQTAERGSRR